jgi:hypothetical protein
MKKMVPTTQAMMANEADSQINFGSVMAVRAKLSAEERAFWN